MNESATENSNFDRYSRQIRFAPIGVEGQRRLAKSRVLIVGVGALGSVTAEILARAGVGYLRLVDRDFVDLSNLQRQSLFDEDDARQGTPKAMAACQRLSRINSEIAYEPIVADVVPRNLAELGTGVDLILDGTDNFEIRFLLNDYCVRESVPWIYTGCLGADGQTMVVRPNVSPCLRCLMPDGPPGAVDTCDTAGVLGPIVHVMAAIQALEAIKILCGNDAALVSGLQVISMWTGRTRVLPLKNLREGINCPTCKLRKFEWLEGNRFTETVRLCGRNSVQINPGSTIEVNLDRLAKRLADLGFAVTQNPFLLRFSTTENRLTIFADGRAIIEGTDDFSIAKSLYGRFIGG